PFRRPGIPVTGPDPTTTGGRVLLRGPGPAARYHAIVAAPSAPATADGTDRPAGERPASPSRTGTPEAVTVRVAHRAPTRSPPTRHARLALRRGLRPCRGLGDRDARGRQRCSGDARAGGHRAGARP